MGLALGPPPLPTPISLPFPPFPRGWSRGHNIPQQCPQRTSSTVTAYQHLLSCKPCNTTSPVTNKAGDPWLTHHLARTLQAETAKYISLAKTTKAGLGFGVGRRSVSLRRKAGKTSRGSPGSLSMPSRSSISTESQQGLVH